MGVEPRLTTSCNVERDEVYVVLRLFESVGVSVVSLINSSKYQTIDSKPSMPGVIDLSLSLYYIVSIIS